MRKYFLPVLVVLLPVSLSVAHVSSAVGSAAALRQASDAIARGQLAGLLESMRHEIAVSVNEISEEELNHFVEEHDDDGLIELRIYRDNSESAAEEFIASRRVQSSAQRAKESEAFLSSSHHRLDLLRVEDEYLATAQLPPGAMGRHGQRKYWKKPQEQRRSKQHLGIVFRSPVALSLEEGAHRLLIQSLLVSLLLSAASMLLGWKLIRSQERMRQRALDEKLKSMGRMSAVLAHEVRNPLAVIKGHAQLLIERLGEGSREQQKAQLIESEALRLEQLSDSLLDFVRPLSSKFEAFRYGKLREGLALQFKELDFEKKDDETLLYGEAHSLQRGVENLLRNAVESGSNLADINLKLQLVGESIDGVYYNYRWLIEDRGCGLNAGEGLEIGEAFVTTKVQGTGLGLSIAKSIAEHHGGELSLKDRAGGGSTVVLSVSMPIASIQGTSKLEILKPDSSSDIS